MFFYLLKEAYSKIPQYYEKLRSLNLLDAGTTAENIPRVAMRSIGADQGFDLQIDDGALDRSIYANADRVALFVNDAIAELMKSWGQLDMSDQAQSLSGNNPEFEFDSSDENSEKLELSE